MKTLCVSVRLASLAPISPGCYKARGFDGTEDLIPSSQVFGEDWEVGKSNAYWISQWILERKKLQWSGKKIAWFDSDTRRKQKTFKRGAPRHIPKEIEIPNHVDLHETLRDDD